MKRIVFEDVHELSVEMLHDVLNFSDCVSAVCHYDMATALLSELIQSEVQIGQIDISDYEWNGYTKEYVVSLMDGNVYCIPAYVTEKRGYSHETYLETYADIMYVHQDCNSKILKYIDCDKIFEFAVNEIDGFEDEEKSRECCNDCEDVDEDITTYHSDSVTVSRDKFGTPTGFTKQWSVNDEDGIFSHTSYSFYCSNEDILRSMAERLDIEL